MPELPEVETVRRKLEEVVLNKEIKDISIFYERIIRKPDPEAFKKFLIGKEFIGVERKGKHLIFKLNNKVIVSHLRMEGKFNYVLSSEPFNKHDHIIFHFDNGYDLRYNDVRKFGTMDLVNNENEVSSVDELGLEPMDPNLNKEYLKDLLSKKKTNIKQSLLDQSIIAGLGNIYVDEVLFDSKILPTRNANKLTDNEISSLIVSVNKIISSAINLGGSSIRTYNSLGVKGSMQNLHKVYGKNGQNCPNCNNNIEKIKIGGRGTHYCPKCQK